MTEETFLTVDKGALLITRVNTDISKLYKPDILEQIKTIEDRIALLQNEINLLNARKIELNYYSKDVLEKETEEIIDEPIK